MNVWNWTSFFSPGPAASGSKVFVHFFPVAAGVSAPYAVEAAVEVFAGGRVLAQQGIEGLRLNQPDGVDLSLLFPNVISQQRAIEIGRPEMGRAETGRAEMGRAGAEMGVSRDVGGATGASASLSSAAGALYGLSIQLGTQQPRVDLSRSRIVVEVTYPSHRLRYHAVQTGQAQTGQELSERYLPESAALFAHEGFDTRIIELNPDVATSARTSVEGGNRVPLLPGCTVRSLPVSPLGRSAALSASPAAGGSGPLGSEFGQPQQEDGIVRFLVRYERSSELPVSVRGL